MRCWLPVTVWAAPWKVISINMLLAVRMKETPLTGFQHSNNLSAIFGPPGRPQSGDVFEFGKGLGRAAGDFEQDIPRNDHVRLDASFLRPLLTPAPERFVTVDHFVVFVLHMQ